VDEPRVFARGEFCPPELLKPCPFCGGHAASLPVAVGSDGTTYNYGCVSCFSVRRFSVDEWNQRYLNDR